MTGHMDPEDLFREHPDLLALDADMAARRAQANRRDIDRLPTRFVLDPEETGRLEEIGMLPGGVYRILEAPDGICHVLRLGVDRQADR